MDMHSSRYWGYSSGQNKCKMEPLTFGPDMLRHIHLKEIDVTERRKQVKERWSCWELRGFLNRVVRVDLNEKMLFEKSLKG